MKYFDKNMFSRTGQNLSRNLVLLLVTLLLGACGWMSGGESGADNTSIGNSSPTATKMPPPHDPNNVMEMRPFTANSPWNTPIGPNPTYDPNSTEMVATIGLTAKGRITSDTSQYTYPVYFVDENTPRWDIECSKYSCTTITLEGVTKTTQLKDVPIPADARPSQGTDSQMIIIDKATYTEYDLWQIKRTATGWHMSNGTVYNMLWDGMAPNYGSRGAGVPYFAGLIRPWEIRQGHIDHVIAFGYPNPAAGRCVFPASKSDGDSDNPYALPEGAHLQLDPTLTEADFARMKLDRTGKIIARALQQYGMILIDVDGRPKIIAEDLTNNPYATEHWSAPDLHLTENIIANIPYTDFRVLAFPPAYWDATADAYMHGECFAHAEDKAP